MAQWPSNERYIPIDLFDNGHFIRFEICQSKIANIFLFQLVTMIYDFSIFGMLHAELIQFKYRHHEKYFIDDINNTLKKYYKTPITLIKATEREKK